MARCYKQIGFIVCMLLVAIAISACSQKTDSTTNSPSNIPLGDSKGSKAEASQVTTEKENANNKQPAALKKIAVGVPAKSLVFLPEYIGVEKGFYKEEGIDLEIKVLKPNAAVAAAISGEVPFTGSLGSSLRSAVTAGSNLKVVMVTLDKLGFSLFGGKGIKSIQELKGKTIMVTNPGATDHYALIEILKTAGLNPDKDVNVVSASTTANSYQGVLGGAAQGAILSPPYSQMAEQEGLPRLKDAIDVVQKANAGLSVPDNYLKANSQEVEKMIRATYKGMKYIREHKDESIAFIEKFWEIKPELAKGAYDDTVVLISKDGMIDEKILEKEIQEAKAESKSNFNGNISDVVDFTIVKKVAK